MIKIIIKNTYIKFQTLEQSDLLKNISYPQVPLQTYYDLSDLFGYTKSYTFSYIDTNRSLQLRTNLPYNTYLIRKCYYET